MLSERIIHAGNLDVYKSFIPENYYSQIIAGELHADVFFETKGEEEIISGVTVTADHAGWLEIVWVSINALNANGFRGSDLLKHRIMLAQKNGKYVGAFFELHVDEKDKVKPIFFDMAEMNVHLSKNNIFELSLKDIDLGNLGKTADSYEYAPPGELSEDTLFDLEDLMESDERPVPKEEEINWDDYLQDISIVCMEKGSPVGTVLISEEEDYLVVELVYSKSSKALLGMIDKAVSLAKEKYPDDRKVLIPIVGKGTKGLVERLLPKAKRGEIIEAVIRFEKPSLSPIVKMTYDQMTTLKQ